MSTKAATCAICAMLAIAAAPLASSASTEAGSWTATASMSTPRDNLTTTPLDNGRVLVVGGVGESTTELYDPPTGTWIPGGTLNQPRWLHEAVRLRDGPATLLRDGRVLVAGGFSGNGTGVQASAELYDPATGRWTSTGSLRTPRRNHTAALLADGTVLVAGGFNSDGWLRDAELYDPGRGRWKRVAPMTIPREHASATPLGDGEHVDPARQPDHDAARKWPRPRGRWGR